MKHPFHPCLFSLGAAVCAAALAAQPVQIPGPPMSPTNLPVRFECGDFWANQRHSALVLMGDGTLWLSYHTAVHAALSQIDLGSMVATDVVCVPNSTGDRFLVTGNGSALAGSFATNGTVQLQAVLDATWVGATSLRARVSASGVRWLVGIQAGTGGMALCIAYALAGQALSALTAIQLPEAAIKVDLADYDGGGTLEIVVVTANAVRVYQPTGVSVATVPWSAQDPWVVALEGTSIGSAVAVVDMVGGSYSATVLNTAGAQSVPLNTSGLELGGSLVVTGLAAVDADGDRLDDDLLVTHAEGDSALRVADPGPSAVQTALSLGISTQPGSKLCEGNFYENENVAFVSYNSTGLFLNPNIESPQPLEPVNSIFAADYLRESETLQLKLYQTAIMGFVTVEVRAWHQDNPIDPAVPPGLDSPAVVNLSRIIADLGTQQLGATTVRILNIPNIVGTNSPEQAPDLWPEHDHYWIELRFVADGGDATPVEMEAMTMQDAITPTGDWDDYLLELQAGQATLGSMSITSRPGYSGLILIRVPTPPQFTDPPPGQG
jgi:hypothetical protein